MKEPKPSVSRIEQEEKPRFKKPTYQQYIDFAILINEGKLEKQKLADMVAMAKMMIDRLYEHGNLLHPSKQEIKDSQNKTQ